MDRMWLGLALAGVMALGSREKPSMATRQSRAAAPLQDSAGPAEALPPAAWLQGDPADSLYRAAREALDRRDYRQAADLFAQVPARFPRSGYAADAYYWRAFSLYRLGGTPQLRDGARSALDTQRERFPKAATKGDAKALASRIQGELARQGDPAAAAIVAAAAADAGRPPVPPTPPVRPLPPGQPAPPDSADAAQPPGDGDDRCADDDDDTKLAALNALQQMDDERARPILQRVLARRDAGSVCLRRKAVFLIAQESAAGTEDILLETARNDPDPEVREQAVFWLSQVGTDRAVGALDSILRTSKDPALQEKAVFALSQHGSARASQALRTYAERPDLPVDLREKAIFWIGQSGGAENEAFLRALYGRLKEEALREKVLFSVSQAGGQENARWLLGDRAGRADSRSSSGSRPSSGPARAMRPITDLTALYASMTDREMREQLIFVYSQRDEPAAVDKLLEIAQARPRPGAPEEGALLARPERRSPRRQGAAGHHRATVSRRPRCMHDWRPRSRCCPARGGRRPDAGPARRRRSATARSGSASPRGPGSAATAGTTSPSSATTRTSEWESDCTPGPVRVSLRVRGGRVAEAHTYVGGRWRPPRGADDRPRARCPPGRRRPTCSRWPSSGRAATRRSWSPPPRWRTARSSGRRCSGWPAATELPLETRRQAVFWLGQAAGEAATRGLDSIAADGGGELEVRKQAVFALSQRPADEGVPALIRIARIEPARRAPEDARSSGWARARTRGRSRCSRRSCGSQVILSGAKESPLRRARPLHSPPCAGLHSPSAPPRRGACCLPAAARSAPPAPVVTLGAAARTRSRRRSRMSPPAPGSAATAGRSWRRPTSRSPSPTSASTP